MRQCPGAEFQARHRQTLPVQVPRGTLDRKCTTCRSSVVCVSVAQGPCKQPVQYFHWEEDEQEDEVQEKSIAVYAMRAQATPF